ncbi:Hydroxymethylglutaryl-CoA reductase [Streptococcus sp. DD13]|nr:Hydroxymethylglutaryl-CoA reductase [Streptococcus sp. DD13]
MSKFSGFSKKSRVDRLQILRQIGGLSEESQATLTEDRNLSPDIAENMVENQIGTFSLPYALLPEITINGKDYLLPMVTEEPSVVAAASFAAKIISRSGGFTYQQECRQMIGQIPLYQISDKMKAKRAIQKQAQELINYANLAYPSIQKRGGGCRSLHVEEKDLFLIVYLHVDVQEAMGANILNTMLEALIPHLESLTGGRALMGILSNYATDSVVSASCRLPLRRLHANPKEAQQLAERIQLASHLAQIDPYRAATHNKGIFNGIDALVLATGNDFRAIEAGAHAFASRDGQYRGLSTWSIEGEELVGQLSLPMPIATVGASIGLNPKVKLSLELLGFPDARTLAGMIASLGLCQNFAALRALVSTGIQAGHMKLQARSLAMQAGAAPHEVEVLSKQLLQSPHMNLATAQELLANLRKS